MPRLLLLLPSTTYRAEEFLEAARRLGVEVTVASDHRSTLAESSPDGLLALNFRDPQAAASEARAFAARQRIDAVVGVDDASVLPAAVIAEALGLPHPSAEAVAAARNKYRTRQALSRAGLRTPWFARFPATEAPERIAGTVPYPCVLKPLVLSASRGVMRADDPESFAAAFRRLAAILEQPDVRALGEEARWVLVEGFIPGREVALEGLLTDGELRTLCLFDKPDPLDGPFFEETLYVAPSRLPEPVQEAIRREAQDAARALGLLEGPVHAELRVNEAGPWVLELHPRSIGGRCSRALRFGTGITLEELILRHALRLPLPDLGACASERRATGVLMLPIPGAGVLQEVRGREAAAAVPGVEEVLVTAHVGQRIVPLPEGAPYAGFVFARGETPEAVEAALREAGRRLEIVLA